MVNQRKFIVKTSVFSGEKPLQSPRSDFLETIRRNSNLAFSTYFLYFTQNFPL